MESESYRNENTSQPSERSSTPAESPGSGYLIVHVTTARGAIPLAGVQVSIRDYLPEFTEPRGDVIVAAVTDRSGNTQRFALPAPPRTASLKPDNAAPFSVYNLEVRLEGYRSQSYIALPVFDGITAVQPVEMIPLPENGTSEAYRPTEDLFFENTVPNL